MNHNFPVVPGSCVFRGLSEFIPLRAEETRRMWLSHGRGRLGSRSQASQDLLRDAGGGLRLGHLKSESWHIAQPDNAATQHKFISAYLAN